METVMRGFDDDPEFYRGYLPDHRNVLSMAVTLATIITMWLLVYFVTAIGPAPSPVQPYSGMLASHFATEAAAH